MFWQVKHQQQKVIVSLILHPRIQNCNVWSVHPSWVCELLFHTHTYDHMFPKPIMQWAIQEKEEHFLVQLLSDQKSVTTKFVIVYKIHWKGNCLVMRLSSSFRVKIWGAPRNIMFKWKAKKRQVVLQMIFLIELVIVFLTFSLSNRL